MKCFKKIVPIILILFIGLKVVMADNEEDDNFGEIFGDIIAFIIGDLIGSCLVDNECNIYVFYIIFCMLIILLVLQIIVCCSGCNERHYNDDNKINRRFNMFIAGMGYGVVRKNLY